MTGPAPAALAVVRAALTDAEHAHDEQPEQVAQRIVDELTEAGWSITAAEAEVTA
ncbi:hypothetical protein ACWGJ2_04370 [Streptomyces sp. NPDC054796]